jgi:hypothetical protein
MHPMEPINPNALSIGMPELLDSNLWIPEQGINEWIPQPEDLLMYESQSLGMY